MNQKHITLFLFSILFIVFSIMGYVLYSGLDETAERKDWEVKSLEISAKINNLLHQNFNQESLLRGYIITREKTFIRDFESSEQEFEFSLGYLGFLVKDNLSQVHRVKELKLLFGARVNSSDSILQMMETQYHPDSLHSLVVKSKEISDGITRRCNSMSAEEETLLKLREADFEAELKANKKSLVGLIVGLLLILIATTLFLLKIFTQINKAKQQVERQNESLLITKENLLTSNRELNKLSSQFEGSLMKSNVAAFDWSNTDEQEFWLSDSLFAMLGYKKENFSFKVEDFFSELMHPDDVPRVRQMLAKHLTEGEIYNPDYRLKKSDGRYKHFRALGSSSVRQGVQSMTGVIIDIDNEVESNRLREAAIQKIEEYSLRFNLVLKSSSYGVWDWFDTDETHQWWSDTFYELIGYRPGELPSSVESFHALVHPDDQEITRDAIEQNIASGIKINIEYRLKTKNHGYVWFRAVGDRIIDDNHPGKIRLMGIVSNISQEKLFSEELKRSNADLQDFAYVASHDLQEPLRKIQAFGDRLKLLCERDYPNFAGNFYIDKMNSSANRMRILIEDLLNFSRVSSESNFNDDVDLNKVMEETKELLSELISSTNAQVTWSKLPTIKEGNKGNLVQLFQNLLSNALKFRKPDVVPVIEIKSEVVDVNEVIKIAPLLNAYPSYHRIEFTDNGIGFDEQYLAKIFTIFQRLHGKSEFEGTGIGLAVCQKICANHEGTITAYSEEGKGATFVVILPEIN